MNIQSSLDHPCHSSSPFSSQAPKISPSKERWSEHSLPLKQSFIIYSRADCYRKKRLQGSTQVSLKNFSLKHDPLCRDSNKGSFCFPSAGASHLDILLKGRTAIGSDGAILPPATADEIVRTMATHMLHVSPPRNLEEFLNFVSYLERLKMAVRSTGVSSLRITVSCTRLEDLEELWRAYTTGALNEAAEKYLVTDAVLRQYNLKELRLTTFIDEEEYRKCKEQLAKCEGTVTMRATFFSQTS